MSAPLPDALRARFQKLIEEGLSGRAAAQDVSKSKTRRSGLVTLTTRETISHDGSVTFSGEPGGDEDNRTEQTANHEDDKHCLPKGREEPKRYGIYDCATHEETKENIVHQSAKHSSSPGL